MRHYDFDSVVVEKVPYNYLDVIKTDNIFDIIFLRHPPARAI